MNDTTSNGIMLALLAAGQSRRFGDEDKLTALLRGRMLGLHAADTLTRLAFDHRIIITSGLDHPCVPGWRDMGYDIIVNYDAGKGQATSVQCAAQLAADYGVSALYICLADMPYIKCQHIRNLSHAFEDRGRNTIIGSSDTDKIMPPAIFPPSQFSALLDLQGDQGARKLLQTAHLVAAPEGSLLDIDTPEILAAENHEKPRR